MLRNTRFPAYSYVAMAVFSLLSPAAGAQVATIAQNFVGTNINQLPALNNGNSSIPPDTMGTAGINHYVETLNGSFAIYNKSTGALVGSRISLTTFWQNAGITGLNNNPSATGAIGTGDPRILFDPNSQRYFVAGIDSASPNRILIAVSNTSDPTAGFKARAINNTSSPGTFADFPMLGIDQNNVYVTTNNFIPSGGGFSSNGAFIIPKSGLLQANPTIANVTKIDNINPNTFGFANQPIVDFAGNGTSHLTLASFDSTNLHLASLDNVNTATPSISSGNFLAVAGNTNTQDARQPGGPNTINTGDFRFSSNVVKQGNNIWGVNTNTVAGDEVVKWYRIDATTNLLVESGTISTVGFDYYRPSINVTACGLVVVGYTRSGTTEFASAYASAGLFNGAATTFDAPTLLRTGAGNYNVTFGGARNRWGDYSSTTLDPTDSNSLWTIQEYASATNVWSTNITRFQAGCPEPGAMALFGTFALAGAGFLRRRRR